MATHGSGGKEQEDEVIPAIRHDDAEWKLIQKNTFTRWVNNHLSKVGESINALDTDFADGLKLIALAAVLSQKNLGKYNKKVSFRSQKLENVSLALNFFQNVEHIKIVNIDSSHIVDHNKKLIMGLIWTLILHYSISMGWTQHNEDGTQSDDTPKTKLLNWIRSRLPGVPITNFTTDWNDGLAIGALVNAISPDSVPDWQSWTPDKALENTQKAMDEAQDKLGIAPLITPAELIHPDIDERSVMTYLSQFPAAKPAPAKPTKAHAYMSRVDEKPLRGQSTEFEVHLTTDGYKPKMTIRDSEGNDVHHTVTKKSSTMFIVKYSPMRVGEHKLHLALTDLGTGATEAVEGGEKIVRVQPVARLRDLPHKVFVKDLVKLEVEYAGDEGVEIVVVDSARTNHALPVLASSDGSLHTAEYIPEHAGLHTVNVFQRKAHIPGSPVRMPVSKKGGYVLYGRGLESDGVRVGDRVEVIVEPESVDSLSVNEGQIALAVRKPDGSFLPVDAVFDSDKDRLTFEYEPTEVGEYTIEATSNGEPIGASPYKVSVSPATPSKVRAFGAGLKSGIVNHPSVFSVETNGQADGLAVSIEGPSKAEISSQDRGNGAALFSYTPMAAGIYKVNLLSRGEHIKDSPFVAQVVDAEEGFHPSAGRVSGPTKPIYTVGEPVPFKIDNRLVGGKKKPSVTVLDANLNNVPVKMSESSPGTYNCEFTPTQPGKYNVDIALAGVALPGTPLSIPVRHPVDLSKLKIFGPGIEGPVISRVPTQFTIDAKEAGGSRDVKDVQVIMADRQGNSVDIDVLDNNDGSFTVKYTAPNAGAYQVNVVFAGEKISPIEINVKPQIDISGIKVEGLENEKALVGTRVTPRIDIGDLAKKGAKPRLLIDKDGHISEAKLNQLSPSVFATQLPLGKPGNYKFMASIDDVPIAEKTVIVQKGQDALKCRAEGKGLTEATVGKKAVFSIDSNGAGDGNVYVEIQGPSEPETFLKQREDGSCEVEFVPKKPGDYNIGILYGDEKKSIRGSPFLCHVDYPLDASQVKVKGLEKKDVQSGEPVEFEIDVTGTKDAPVTASVPPIYQQPLVEKSQSNPRIYKAKFTPVGEVGEQIPITVNYDGKPLSASPFLVKLQPKPHPDNVQIVQSPIPSDQEQEDKAGTILASREAIVILDLKNCGDVKSCEAVIIGPDGQRRDCIVARGQKANEIEIRWKTDVAGIYKADVYFDGIKVNKSVEVEALPTASSQDVIREYDAVSTAGSEMSVGSEQLFAYTHDDSDKAKLTVRADRPDAVQIALESKPHEKDRHKKTEIIHVKPTAEGANTIHVYYGGTEVDNFTYQAHRQSPSTPASSIRDHIDSVVDHQESAYYRQQSSRSSSTSQPSVRLPAAASVSPAKSLTHHSSSTSIESSATDHLYTREFKLNLESGLHSRDLQAEVSMPSSQTKKDTAEIVDNHDGSVSVRYTPKTTGAHELNILHKGAPLQGTPIKFYVDSYADGFATVYGPGLQSAIVGEPAHFTVCARKSNAKELSVSIEGPAKSNIKIHDNKDGTCSVAWVPPVPGEYKAHVSLGGKEVKDSPFTVLVMGEGQKRSHLSVGSTSEVALNINQQELKGISASIKSPSGIEEPCHVRMIDGGRLGVSFTPRESGEHLITVKRDGKLLPKAPFKIKVDKSQVGDASKVEVSGAGKAKAVCCEENELLVDTTKAGYGGLSVSVQGPSKAELRCKEVKAGLIKVLYKPTEPGVYAISVKFADHHVSNSPFTVNCTGKGLGRVQQQFNRKAEQASMVLANQESLVYMKLPGTSPMDTNAKVKDPKGKTEDVEMRDLGQQFYQIKFKPKMEGVHTLSILHKDAHIVGSPFQFTVGVFSDGGAHKVRATGVGIARGETNTVNSFNIYTREAGAGQLSMAIEGPSKAAVEFHDHKDGNCHVDYKVTQPGEYLFAIKFNDVHIADSPFKVFIAPATGEARKLELASFHDQGVPAGKAFTFTVLTHRAKGHLEAKVVTTNNEVETIDIVPIEEGESYALRFVPKCAGNHYIHVTLDGAPMRDSPFRIRVGGVDSCDPTAISASGDGLKKAQTGQKCEFIVNTVNAGAGILTCQMDGPSKATLDAYELEKGYKVRYTALAPGDYFCAIKYNAIHIPGSPFRIPVEGQVLGGNGYNETSMVRLDAAAKTSKGTVVQAPTYTGDASKVEVKGAGLNKFFPGRIASFTIDTQMAGTNLLFVGVVTTKGPVEEVTVRHQGGGHYVVSYKIPDRLKGFIFINYGEKPIPGSPFAIEP